MSDESNTDVDTGSTSLTGGEENLDQGVDTTDVSDDAGDQGGNADESAETGAPESYADFSLPEGMSMDEAMLTEASGVFKELNLNQEQAQKLIDIQAKSVQANQTGQIESFNQLKQDWLDQAKNDKDIGGEKFDTTVADAKKFLSKFGSPGLSEMLDELGVGNHPEFIRAFAAAGSLMKEDSPGVRTDTGRSEPETHREKQSARIQNWYGDS